MGRRQPVSLALLLLVAACGSSPGGAPTSAVISATTTTSPSVAPSSTTTQPAPTSTSAPAPEFEYIGTVIESPDHGPEACAALVLMSLPPQCRGVPLPNLDWDTVPWAEEVRGTTWAEMVLTGHFDGRELILIAPPEPVPVDRTWEPGVDFTPPCDDPPGGWTDTQPQVVEATAAIAYAEAQGGFAGHWLARPDPAVDQVVQVFAFTGELADHEQRLRELYDGAICVWQAPRSLADLENIRNELKALLWSDEAVDRGIYTGFEEGYLLASDTNVLSSSVTVVVLAVLDKDAATDWLNSLYGEGAVRLSTVLTRVGT